MAALCQVQDLLAGQGCSCQGRSAAPEPDLLQVLAHSAPLPGCSALRWSECGTLLAVPCAAEVRFGTLCTLLCSCEANLHGRAAFACMLLSCLLLVNGARQPQSACLQVAILNATDLTTAATLLVSSIQHGFKPDCAWLPGTSQLAVWAAQRSSGALDRFALACAPTWQLSAQIGLAGPLRRPAWGPLQRLAATAEDGDLLLLYSFSDASGDGAQLLASLPAAQPVHGEQYGQPALRCYAWQPHGRFVAVLRAAPSSGLTLEILDAHRGGAIMSSYSLVGTQGSTGAGRFNVYWSSDRQTVNVCIDADSFPRKWEIVYQCSAQGCCEKACHGARCGHCSQYGHRRVGAHSMADLFAGMGPLLGLLGQGP